MKLVIVLTATLPFLAACATVEAVGMRDGRGMFQAKCHRSTADCHRKASETCAGEYEVLDTSTRLMDNYMMFQCKK